MWRPAFDLDGARLLEAEVTLTLTPTPNQVASVSVLLGSSVVSLSRNEPWITPVQGLAYVLMFIGGAPRPRAHRATGPPAPPAPLRQPRHCATRTATAPRSRALRLLRA